MTAEDMGQGELRNPRASALRPQYGALPSLLRKSCVFPNDLRRPSHRGARYSLGAMGATAGRR
jgi:hypothetical protein